jgi:hypothetical protein
VGHFDDPYPRQRQVLRVHGVSCVT